MGATAWLCGTPACIGAPSKELRAAVEVFKGIILKSPADPRDYRAITLANGLRALLVSDPKTAQASAALSVHVGFNSDPDGLPGLAHFCEHMLFLGNSDYPEENSFKRFTSANGGSQNAFTSETDTTYFFDVSPAAFQEALVRFAAFFRSPLFTASATEREVNAIESEDAKNRQNDGFRLNQLSKSFALEGHPQRRFGTGNRETLGQKGPRDALLDFFKLYDAGIMALCVVGREPVGTLQEWALSNFSGIANRALPNPMLRWRGVNPYPATAAGEIRMLEAVPVAEQRSLAVTWSILFSDEIRRSEWLKAKPQTYIAHLVGHEGERSFQSLLKRRGWANRVSAGVANEDDNFCLFRVAMDITSQGLEHRDDIIELLFAVLNRIRRGIPAYIFKECQDLCEMRWRFAEKQPAQRVALGMVDVMQDGIEPGDYLSCRPLLFQPALGSIEELTAATLRLLTPQGARYSCVAREFAASARSKERWYGTAYTERTIPPSTVSRWEKPAELAEYDLPRPNEFIPRGFGLKQPLAPPSERDDAAEVGPALIRSDSRWQVFFKADRSFGVPKANVRVILWMPPDVAGADVVPSRLWQLALADRLRESYYDAGLAGLDVGVSVATSGLTISCSGFSDRLPLLVEDLVGRIRTFDGPSVDEFERALDLVKREQQTFDVSQPYSHAGYYARLATVVPEYPIETLRAQAASVTLPLVRKFGDKFRSDSQRLLGRAFFHGNLNLSDVREIMGSLEAIPFQPLAQEDFSRIRFIQLPAGKDFLVARPEPNPRNENHALTCTYWTGTSVRETLLTELLQVMIKDPFFDALRTRQQLGYIVNAGFDRVGLVVRLSLVVQSSVGDPDRLLRAVDDFLVSFRAELAALPAAQLKQFKLAIVDNILERDERLGQETNRWWGEILAFQYEWKRRENEAALIKDITGEDLLAFFDERVAAGGPLRRRLVSAVFAASRDRESNIAAMESRCREAGVEVINDTEVMASLYPRWPLQDRPLPAVAPAGASSAAA